MFPLLSPRHFNSSSPQVRCSIREPGVFSSGDQGMNFQFFISSAPPSALQLLKSGVQCMNVQLLFSSAVTWTLQLTLCFLFPLLLPALSKSGYQGMSFRFFVSSAPPSTPQLLKSGVQCMNVQLLFPSAITWTLQLTLCFWFPLLLPALFKSGDQGMSFRFFVSSAPRPTPQLLNSSTQLLKRGVRCRSVLLLV